MITKKTRVYIGFTAGGQNFGVCIVMNEDGIIVNTVVFINNGPDPWQQITIDHPGKMFFNVFGKYRSLHQIVKDEIKSQANVIFAHQNKEAANG